MSILIKSKHAGWTHEGVRHFNKGSGGGQSERDATPEERALWKAQGDSLTQMTNIAMPNLTAGMNNLGVMANESMDGTLSNRMRGMAAADSNASFLQNWDSTTRGMNRYGAEYNPGQMANAALQNANKAALGRTNAMNMANMAAEDVKWNRNSALTGLASGQGASAISGMGGLSNALAQNRQAGNAADAQSQAGLGMMGAYGLNVMMKKDGGYIGREPHMASGGMMKFQKAPSPAPVTLEPFAFSGADEYNGPSAISSIAQPAALMYGLNNPGKIMDAGKDVLNGAPQLQQALGMGSDVGSLTVDGATAGLNPAASGAGLKIGAGTGSGAGASLATPGLASAGGDAALGSAATGATVGGEAALASTAAEAGSAAAAGGATGAMGAIGAAAPYLALAYGVGSMLDLWKDGGPVPHDGDKRNDFSGKGGKVSGPGTETSDSIPARLSDGEYVLNAEAVKMVGKDKLDAINNAGLQRRGDEPKLKCGGGVRKMAMGGFLTGLGNVGRGFVPTAMRLDEQDRFDARMAKQDARAEAADTRTQQQFDMTMAEANRKIKNRDALSSGVKAGLEKAGPNLSEAKKTFTMLEAGFNAARDNGDMDAMFSFQEKMKPAQQALIGDHVGRAYRASKTITDPTARRTAVANELSSIYRFIPDGDDVDGFIVDPDGVSFKMKSGATQKYDDAGLTSLLSLAQDPKAVMDAEIKGATERSGKAWEWQNKPMTVGKDESIVTGTGQTFSPGAANRKFDPKEQQAVGDDIRNHALQIHGKYDPTSGKWEWTPKAIQTADTMESLFSNGHALPITQMRQIAEGGKPGQAKVTVNGKPATVNGISFGGKLYLMDGSGTTIPMAGNPQVSTGNGTREVTGKISPRAPSAPGLTPIKPQSNASPAGFPRVSPEQQSQRDILAGQLAVEERGADVARRDLAEIDAALKSNRLDGTQRQILQSERNRIASGLAAAS